MDTVFLRRMKWICFAGIEIIEIKLISGTPIQLFCRLRKTIVFNKSGVSQRSEELL